MEYRPGKYAAAAAILAAVVLAAATSAPSQQPTTKEYMVKATCLFNFALFVEWPSNAFADAVAPIAIGVLGDDEFGPFLDQLIRGETVKNRPLTVKRSRSVEDLKGCHILFISRSEKPRQTQILARLRDENILIVGETEGFTLQGGVIRFYLHEGTVRFEINPQAAERRGLKISAQLLRLGRIIQNETATTQGGAP